MKKILITVLAFTFTALNSNAVENIWGKNKVKEPTKTVKERIDSRAKMQIGFKLGINNSNVYDTKGEQFNADAKFGFAAGGFVALPINELFGVQPEMMFSQKGFQASSTVLGNTYNFTRTTNYIDVPILFSFKPIEFVNLLAGPQFSYLMKQRDVFSNSSSSINQEQVFSNDNLRKNVLCFTGGANVNIANIVISARVGWDLQNNKGDGTSTNPRYKNAWSQFTFGYRFY